MTTRRTQDRGRPRLCTENPPLPRKVHVDGAVWTYKFNRDFVLILNPERTQTFRAWIFLIQIFFMFMTAGHLDEAKR